MLFLITILIVSRIWHSSNYTFVHCWSRPHTLPLSPWCQLLPSEPRVYWVYLLRLWPNHIYPTVFTRCTHCDAAMTLSLFWAATFCPVAPPLLPSTHFDFWRQTVHYVANMQLWTSSNGNNMWETRRKERKTEFIGTNEYGKDFKRVVTCNERRIKSAHGWLQVR